MKTKISNYLSEIVTGISAEEFYSLLEIPPDEKMGDYALPCEKRSIILKNVFM